MEGTLDAAFIAVETTHAAVLFADMRGYTGLAERLPVRVVPLLDEFFTILGRVTVAFGGQVFHTAGDTANVAARLCSRARAGEVGALRIPQEVLIPDCA